MTVDFDQGEDQRMLADTLRRYLADRYPFETRNGIARSREGFSREQWGSFAKLGIIAALFDEAAGGFAGSGFDIGLVFELLGRALVVEPFLGTVMAGRALARAGGHDALLARAIAGQAILALALDEFHNRYDFDNITTCATWSGSSWTLTGAKTVVTQLEAASHVVVSAITNEKAGLSLFLVETDAAGLGMSGYPMIDGGHGGELTLDRTPATLVGIGGEASSLIEEVLAAGIVALSFEAVGIMDVLKVATLDYLRVRKQFGVAIGKFQAVQHRLATVALEIEQARSAAINVAAALDGERVTRERAVSAAKFTIGRVGTLVAEEAIQLHGGIGMTWELSLSHYAKRLIMIGHQHGDEDYHLERFITLGLVAT